jgi:hypothetical protein
MAPYSSNWPAFREQKPRLLLACLEPLVGALAKTLDPGSAGVFSPSTLGVN